jgi:hypothetical protein
MALVERLHGQGGDWRVALFTHAPAIDELSLSPGSAADAGHIESAASALLCRLGWENSLDGEAGLIVIFLHVCIY